MGRGHRAQSPVHTTVLPSKHKRKRGVESALGLAAPVLLSHPPCLWRWQIAPDSHLPGPRAVPCSSALRCRLGQGLTSRFHRCPTARLAFAAASAARRSARSHPRPSGSDNPGCPPLWLCAPRSQTRSRRNTVTRGGAPGSPPVHTRAHAPRP